MCFPLLALCQFALKIRLKVPPGPETAAMLKRVHETVSRRASPLNVARNELIAVWARGASTPDLRAWRVGPTPAFSPFGPETVAVTRGPAPI